MFIKLNWREAKDHPFCNLEKLKEDNSQYIGAIVKRPDGRKVKIFYYQLSETLMAVREKADGNWGASRRYSADREGWIKAIQHNLPRQYRFN